MLENSHHNNNYMGYGVLVLPDHRILAIRRVVTNMGHAVPGMWSCSVYTKRLGDKKFAGAALDRAILKVTGMSVPETEGSVSNRHVFSPSDGIGRSVVLYSYHIKQTIHMKVPKCFEVKPIRFGALLTILNDDDAKLGFTYDTETIFKQLQQSRWRPNGW